MDRQRRGLPSYESRWWQQYDHALHRERIKKMKPAVDTTAPKQPAHLKSNVKRQMALREHYREIEQENLRLLARMTRLVTGNASIDNTNRTSGIYKSTFSQRRKMELLRITEENQHLLNRLQRTESVYNRLDWARDRAKHERFVKSMCYYKDPYTLQLSNTEEELASVLRPRGEDSRMGGRSPTSEASGFASAPRMPRVPAPLATTSPHSRTHTSSRHTTLPAVSGARARPAPAAEAEGPAGGAYSDEEWVDETRYGRAAATAAGAAASVSDEAAPAFTGSRAHSTLRAGSLALQRGASADAAIAEEEAAEQGRAEAAFHPRPGADVVLFRERRRGVELDAPEPLRDTVFEVVLEEAGAAAAPKGDAPVTDGMTGLRVRVRPLSDAAAAEDAFEQGVVVGEAGGVAMTGGKAVATDERLLFVSVAELQMLCRDSSLLNRIVSRIAPLMRTGAEVPTPAVVPGLGVVYQRVSALPEVQAELRATAAAKGLLSEHTLSLRGAEARALTQLSVHLFGRLRVTDDGVELGDMA